FMHETRAFRPKTVLLTFEQTGIIGGKQSASNAAQPSRERSYRYADESLRRKRIDRFAALKRGHSQILNLGAELAANGGQKPCFVDWLTAARVPSINGQGDDRQIG